jgi:hypothetical protein
MSFQADKINERIEGLKERIKEATIMANRLEAGDELCTHHWNGCDRCYEIYCTGCGSHIGEKRDDMDIPFKDDEDANCYQCRKSPEQKEQEKLSAERMWVARDLKKLAALKLKYPEA